MLARTIAIHYPAHIQAIHLNFIPVAPPYPWKQPLRFLTSLFSVPFSTKDRASIARSIWYLTTGNAYYKQQESRPQTLGYGLHDSPVALLAWIYDKLHSWSDDYKWTDEEILTWVSIYYFSRAGPAASTRIYFEASAEKPDYVERWMSLKEVIGGSTPAEVRVAVAQFKEELIKWPVAWYRAVGNVVREREFDVGGHFAAWEVPEVLASDVKAFLGKGGEAYAVVEGRDGY